VGMDLTLRVLNRYAMEHPSEKARKEYLHEHPRADPKNHQVAKPDGGKSKGDGPAKGKKTRAEASKAMQESTEDFDDALNEAMWDSLPWEDADLAGSSKPRKTSEGGLESVLKARVPDSKEHVEVKVRSRFSESKQKYQVTVESGGHKQTVEMDDFDPKEGCARQDRR